MEVSNTHKSLALRYLAIMRLMDSNILHEFLRVQLQICSKVLKNSILCQEVLLNLIMKKVVSKRGKFTAGELGLFKVPNKLIIDKFKQI